MWEGSSSQEGTKGSLALDGRARDILRSRNWGVEVREPVVEEVSVLDGGSVSVRHVSSWSVSGSAVNAREGIAKFSHEHSEGNINNIISWSASVGESSKISSNNSQRVLSTVSSDRCGGVESQQILEGSSLVVLEGIKAGNSLEEGVNQILSGEIVRLEARKSGSKNLVDRCKEERVENHGKSGVENIVVESLSEGRGELIPSILGDESSEELVDQRICHPALLSMMIGTEGGIVDGFSSGPDTNNSVSGSDQTRGGNFQSNSSNVSESEDIVG